MGIPFAPTLRRWLRSIRRPAARASTLTALDDDLRAALLELLEGASLPPACERDRDILAHDLRTAATATDAAPLVRRITELVVTANERETQTLERGLVTYARQLTALDAHLRAEDASRADVATEQTTLEQQVHERVRDIRRAVRGEIGADNEGSGPRVVESHLARIVGQLRSFSARQNERLQSAEAEARELRERLREAEAETTRLRRSVMEHKSRAAVDGLTGIPNRQAYDERFDTELARRDRHSLDLALVVTDIDHFKRINDQHGHMAGDRVLGGVAATLRENVRASDFIARYGGEEFVVLLPETAGDGGREVAEKLRRAVREQAYEVTPGEPVQVTLSAGVTEVQSGDTRTTAFERADQALYDAKRAGRDRVMVRLR
ncbi:GGDEF domain-containing protein [Arhodomonas sp. AD133]|uniref:GGDEF domain-containing protein n=1 Tax=Arhodomonas sp. AD133 TaxID=3415009 RepID=UPI003EBA925F